jgi:hypothetical protein
MRVTQPFERAGKALMLHCPPYKEFAAGTCQRRGNAALPYSGGLFLLTKEIASTGDNDVLD